MDLLSILNRYYPIRFDRIEPLRDAGNVSYKVLSGSDAYFLREIKPAFRETAITGADIQVFLQRQGFSVPPVVFTREQQASLQTGNHLLILYAFIEGVESDPQEDAEAIGALIGDLHQVMRSYPGTLIKRDWPFYIGRYLNILRAKNYPQAQEYADYAVELWDRVKDLPRGYSHGDMYVGNIHKTPDSRFYVLDFDTSCDGLPMYDLALVGNRTHYFDYDANGCEASRHVYARLLSGYLTRHERSQRELDAFYDLIALYHYTLQATILEIHGLDCVDHRFLDRQLNWLYQWREQCRGIPNL